MQCNSSFLFSRSKIKSNIFPLLLGLGRQFDARYTTHLKLNTEHIIRLALYLLCPQSIQGNYIFQFQGQRSNRTYFRCYWGKVDNSMPVILRIWSLIQSTSSGLHCINSVPSQFKANTYFTFEGQRSNRTYYCCYWIWVDNSLRVILRIWSLIQSTSSGLRYINSDRSQIQWISSFLFSRSKI
jgi:hypothetical protein